MKRIWTVKFKHAIANGEFTPGTWHISAIDKSDVKRLFVMNKIGALHTIMSIEPENNKVIDVDEINRYCSEGEDESEIEFIEYEIASAGEILGYVTHCDYFNELEGHVCNRELSLIVIDTAENALVNYYSEGEGAQHLNDFLSGDCSDCEIDEYEIDKTNWETGEWNDEHDWYDYVDNDTGAQCHIKRNGTGALCGYIQIPAGSPLHGMDYDELNLQHGIEVHGGLTYSGAIPSLEGFWIGFDCSHYNDLVPGLLGMYPNEVGQTYKNVDYVRAELTHLAEQVS